MPYILRVRMLSDYQCMVDRCTYILLCLPAVVLCVQLMVDNLITYCSVVRALHGINIPISRVLPYLALAPRLTVTRLSER